MTTAGPGPRELLAVITAELRAYLARPWLSPAAAKLDRKVRYERSEVQTYLRFAMDVAAGHFLLTGLRPIDPGSDADVNDCLDWPIGGGRYHTTLRRFHFERLAEVEARALHRVGLATMAAAAFEQTTAGGWRAPLRGGAWVIPTAGDPVFVEDER